MNQYEGVGVILTSHDASDIEVLCKRVIIINHGQIIFQDKVSNLKRRYLTSKLIDVRYGEELDSHFSIPGTETLKIGRYGAKLQFNTKTLTIDEVLGQVNQFGNVVDITISDPSLEEVIRTIYEESNAG
jgi:ABC-2 type transport system ATP-binding protein